MEKYKIRYNLQTETRPEGFSKEDAQGKGLTDALMIVSIINHDDGAYSQAIFTFDGEEKRPLTQNEVFKAWMMLGLSLADKGEVEGWQKDCIDYFAFRIRDFLNDNIRH